jgi:hypothetical protein
VVDEHQEIAGRPTFQWGGKGGGSAKTGHPMFLNGIQIAGKFVQRPVIVFAAPRRRTKSLIAAELDSLRTPLKVIQERAGHALTGSFTLDVYGVQPEWERNVEAAGKCGFEIERSVQEAESFDSLTAVSENGSQVENLEAA